MLSERRQLPRAIPNLPLVVYCGEYDTGSLVDVCEGGLALEGFAPGNSNDVINVMFDLPETRAHIQATGQIAWADHARHRVGMRFVEIADSCRQELRDWVAARVAATGAIAGAVRQEASYVRFSALAAEPATIMLQEPAIEEETIRHRRAQHLVWLAIGVLSLFAAAIGVHYFGNQWQLRNIKAAEKAPEIPSVSPAEAVKPVMSENQNVPGVLSMDASGFVVQVAAMKQEENADKLSEALHQKNFPAFVFKRGASPFYRVAVGVYGDNAAAARVQDELRDQGFPTILRRWSTE